MKLSSCLTFSGVGILTIASTRSSDGFRPSADHVSQVCDMLLEELTLVETQFHTILGRCSEDLLDILQVFFLRPSSDDHIVQPHTECQKPDCRLISGRLLVPVQMTIDCTEIVPCACLRQVVSLWHHRALLVNMHRTYQVLRSALLLAAWRTTRLPSEWGAGLQVAGGLQSLCSLRICALSRSASARPQWVSPIHCGQLE